MRGLKRIVVGLLCGLVLASVACSIAYAFTLVQSKSGFAPTLTFDSPPSDSNLLHAYSSTPYFYPSGGGYWTPPVDDGTGVLHSYLAGPFPWRNADGTITVRGAPGRTPPPIAFAIEELAP